MQEVMREARVTKEKKAMMLGGGSWEGFAVGEVLQVWGGWPGQRVHDTVRGGGPREGQGEEWRR